MCFLRGQPKDFAELEHRAHPRIGEILHAEIEGIHFRRARERIQWFAREVICCRGKPAVGTARK